MRLIKILRNRVQIRTDSGEFSDVRIGDLMSVGDSNVTLAVMVASVSDADTTALAEEEEDYLLPPSSMMVLDCSIIGSIRDGAFEKVVSRYPTMAVDVKQIEGGSLQYLTTSDLFHDFIIGEYVESGVAAAVNGNRFFQRHSCIVGNTGAGKSETVASILEKAASRSGANLILFDLHGEYGHFSYVDNIKFGKEMDFPIWMFGLRDMAANILKVKEESATVAMSALRRCYRNLCPNGNEGKPEYFDYDRLIGEIKLLNAEEVSTGEVYKSGDKAGMYKTIKGELNGKLGGIINTMEEKLHDKRYSFLFTQHGPEYLYELANRLIGGDRPVRNIDLSGVPHDVAVAVVGAVTKTVYEIQKASGRKDRPLTFVCDEAHVYIPANFQLSASERRLVEIFENIAKEGRKFGVTLLVASQRPSELNKTIMAQCANFIVMKLNNENDKAMMKSMLPDGSCSIIDETTMFAPGEAVVVGDAAQIPLKVKVQLAKERPQSRTVDFWDEWAEEKPFDASVAVDAYLQ